MGGEALTMTLICSHSLLRTEEGPHPNVSKVEGLIHFKRDEERGPDSGPYVLL